MFKNYFPFIQFLLDIKERVAERRFSARDRAINELELNKTCKEHLRYLQEVDFIYQATGKRLNRDELERIEIARIQCNNKIPPEELYQIHDRLEQKNKNDPITIDYTKSDKINYVTYKAFTEWMIFSGFIVVSIATLLQIFSVFEFKYTFQALLGGLLICLIGCFGLLGSRKPVILKKIHDNLVEEDV